MTPEIERDLAILNMLDNPVIGIIALAAVIGICLLIYHFSRGGRDR